VKRIDASLCHVTGNSGHQPRQAELLSRPTLGLSPAEGPPALAHSALPVKRRLTSSGNTRTGTGVFLRVFATSGVLRMSGEKLDNERKK